MKVLAIDPSLSCSGWALVSGDFSAPKILFAGTLKLKKDALPDRTFELFEDVQSLLNEYLPCAAVVEMPQTFSIGFGNKRSAASLPGYGMATAAALLACRSWVEPGIPKTFTVLNPSASVWTKGYPKTKGDAHKQARVHHAALLYGTIPQFFGAKTTAGNVADAALLGHWALCTLETEHKRSSR